MKQLILLLCFVGFMANTQAQTPSNDDIANAINLTVGATCISGTTVGSSFDVASPSCGGNSTDGNVWYYFTATSTQSTIEVTNANTIDVELAVYGGSPTAEIQCADVTYAGGNETILFTSVAGAVYIINVKQYDSNSGTFCIRVNGTISNAPVNDDAPGAVNLTLGASCTAGTTVNSTNTGFPNACSLSSAGDVWYKFTATAVQSIVKITNVSSGLDVVLTAFDASANDLQCADIGGLGANEQITFTSVIGTVYYICVSQKSTSGTFCVAVSNPPAPVVPANNNCANAIALTPGAACINGTTVNATPDGTFPSCGGNPNTGNVWYKFTAASTQSKVDVTNISSSLDVVLAVHASCGGASIQCASNGGSSQALTFPTTIGITYLINILGFYGSSSGTFCIAVTNMPPINDNCSSATNLTVGAACTSATTVNSTFDGTLPSCGGTSSTGNIWYKFTAAATISKIDVTNVSGFDPTIAVYSSCSGGSIDCINANGANANESLVFSTTIGVTYLINLKQTSASSGSCCIAVSNVYPPVNDNCSTPINLIVGAPCIAGTTLYSTFDGMMPACGVSNSQGNVWYQFIATSTISKIVASYLSPNLNIVLAVHSSCGSTNMHCADSLALGGNESIRFASVVGTTYLINVKQVSTTGGDFCIELTNYTGIEEFAHSLSIYPNPVADNVTIESSNFSNPVSAFITNALGQTIKSIKLTKEKQEINISELQDGTYFLQIPEWNVAKVIVKN